MGNQSGGCSEKNTVYTYWRLLHKSVFILKNDLNFFFERFSKMLHPVKQQGYLQTGQTSCHDVSGTQVSCAGSGQDAEFQNGVAWPTPRFQPKEEVVVDRLTGLTWTRDANLHVYPLTWQEALAYVSEMNRHEVLGYADWRLPNRREL